MKKLTKKRTPPKTGSAPRKPRAKRGRKRSAGSVRKAPAGLGASRLRSSVNTILSKQSHLIALALVNKAKKGNMTSTPLLVVLSGADQAPPEPRKKRSRHSWAELLASEPDCDPGMENSPDGNGAITVLADGTIKRDASKLPPSDYDLSDDLE